MNPDLVIRFIFAVGFVLNLLAGIYLLRHQERLLGPSSGYHTDTVGARDYNKLQIWATWVHVALLTGAFAVLY